MYLIQTKSRISKAFVGNGEISMKGVIPAAGHGKRLEPLTLAMPKEMIRVGTKPVIEHVINNLKACDISEIMVIIGWKKGALIDYLGSGKRSGVNIVYGVQDEQLGVADAVHKSKKWVGEENFVVIYGDNYYRPPDTLNKAVELHNQKGAAATLVLHPVEDPRRWGIVKMDDDGKVLGMIEKPTLEEAESYKTNGIYYNIAGLLVLSPKVFEYIEKIQPGKNNELQMTDAIELMRKDGHSVYGTVLEGVRFDIGTFESLMEADHLEQNQGL